MESLAQERSLIVVVEDIHWAEDTLLDLLEYLRDFSRGAALLIVCLARQELLEHRSDWGGPSGAPLLRLAPLEGHESEGMVRSLLGEHAVVPLAALEWVAAVGQGNPLFTEELLRMLVEDGVLARDAAGWSLRGELEGVAAPPTIQALLGARLERLSEGDRTVAQAAAVVGQVFWWSAVAALAPEVGPALGGSLRTLMRQELVEPDESSFADEDAFRFAHILIRDAAYQALLKDVRARMHETFADWLEGRAQGRTEEYEGILGYHLEQAYNYRVALARPDPAAQRLAARAAVRLGAAGERAEARGDVGAAVSLLQRAVALLPADAEERQELTLALASARRAGGELTRARELARSLVTSAQTTGNRRVEVRANLSAVSWACAQGEATSKQLRDAATEALPVLEDAGDEIGLWTAWGALLYVDMVDGDYTSAAESAERAREHARRAGDLGRQRLAETRLALALVHGPLPVEDVAQRLHDLAPDPSGAVDLEPGLWGQLAIVEAMRGNFERARALSARGEDALRALGQLLRLAGSQGLVSGLIELMAEDASAAERLLRSSASQLRERGEMDNLSTVLPSLAQALLLQGRFQEAEEAAREAQSITPDDDLESQIAWRTVWAPLIAARGEFQTAEKLAREAIALADTTDLARRRGEARLSLASVLAAQTRRLDATAAAEDALAIFERKGIVPLIRRAREAAREYAATAE